MKRFNTLVLASVVTTMLFATSANAGWMMVNDDGSLVPYTADCCHVTVKKRVHHKKRCVCTTCDYSQFPEAETLPLEPGEHLKPAKLGFCGRK